MFLWKGLTSTNKYDNYPTVPSIICILAVTTIHTSPPLPSGLPKSLVHLSVQFNKDISEQVSSLTNQCESESVGFRLSKLP